MRVSSTEIQNNFGKYLKIASEQETVIITKNGRDIAKIAPCYGESRIAEHSTEYAAKSKYRVSYEEFLELTKNSDFRYELIDGEVFCLEAPNYYHQMVVAELFVSFYSWFKGKKCRPLTSPFDVTLFKEESNRNVVQPDIIVICDTEKVDEHGRYRGVPSLVVEVLSGSTRRNDMIKKTNLYMQTGVKEYWIVDPDKKQIYIYNFEESDVKDFKTCMHGDSIRSETFEGLEIELSQIFAGDVSK